MSANQEKPLREVISEAYAALKAPTVAQYEEEKQRILKAHGRETMLAFAKQEVPDDYLAEVGKLNPDDFDHAGQRAAREALAELRQFRSQGTSADAPEHRPDIPRPRR